MASFQSRVFLSGILTLLLSSCVLTEISDHEVDSILEEIQNEYTQFEIGEQKSFILVLGNSGTGKSTLALLLTGADLEAKRVSPGVFSIEDKNDLISRNSTITSKTKVPNLMIDRETNTTFYDCPGFADSRGVVIDITATRSIHDLIDFANEIKLLFTVSYESVENVIGDRKSLRKLAGHAVNLIKDLEKYAKGMTLVVTKVRKLIDCNDEGEQIEVDDALMIASIADFIKQAKSDLESKRATKMTIEESRLNNGKIKFLEIFLERESNKYTRINIFRMVDRPGPLKNMPIIQKEKELINEAINSYIDYVPTDIDDFGYPISEESQRYVASLITKLGEKLENLTQSVCTDLKSFYNGKKQMINSVEDIKKSIGVNNFFQLRSNGEFIKHFNQSVISLGIEMNADILKNVSRSIGFVDFLESLSKNNNTLISKQVKGTLQRCAIDLFDDVRTQIRIDVPRAILDLQQNYVERGHSDSQVLNKLKTFFSLGLENTTGVNSTVLGPLLNLTTDEHVTRNVEFLDFLQMLSDEELSVKMSRELEVCVKDMKIQTETTFVNDMHNIFDAIKAFYVQEERQSYLNFEDIMMTISMIKERLSEIGTNSSETFVKDLFDVVSDLNISGLIRDNVKILKNIEFLKSLQENSTVSSKIISDLNTCKKYVDDSQTWYSFLLILHDHLLTYNVQQNSSLRKEGQKLLAQSISNEDDTRSSNEIALKPILDSLNEKLFTDAMENMRINVFKLKAAQELWSQTMLDFESSCTPESDRLTVKGYVVSISNVVKLKCWPNAKFIDIFALNKIFFDADIGKVGKRTEISIISPIWEILGNETRIDMQGEHGIDYTAAATNASKETENGEDGLPGKPGGPGGCYLGIGSSFINGHQLLIDVTGGEGGAGQRGGIGGNGIEGETPPRSFYRGFVTDFKQSGFWCEETFYKYENNGANGFDDYYNYTCYGKNGTRGGKGGNGGCGGKGGNPGQIFVIGLDEIPTVDIFNKTGTTGVNGDGGLGGRETMNGRTFFIKVHGWNRIFSHYKQDITLAREIGGPYIATGDKGDFGSNCNGIEKPENVSCQSLSSITAYQEYARENLLNNVWRPHLEQFVNGLTNNKTFDSFFNTIGLIEVFNSLEKQYFHLHKKIDFTPYYQTLKYRIERYVPRMVEISDEQKSVKLLYTAVISKLLSIENQANQIAVSDLLTYIETINGDIAQLKEDKRIEYITKQRDDYKSSLDEKMKSATEMVQNMVVPSIDQRFGETERNVQELLNEAIVKHNETEEALEKAKENKKKLQKSILWHNILAPLKVIGSLLALAGPEGAIVGALVSGGASIAESVIDGGLKTKDITTPVAPYQKLIDKITNDFMRQQLLFSEQLSDLDNILGEDNSTSFDEMREVVKNVTLQLNETMKFDKNFVTNATDQVQKSKKAIEDVLDKTKSYFDDLKKKGKEVEKSLKNIERMEKLIKVADVGIDIYKQNRKDNKKLDEINKQIEDLQDQLNTWKQYEENIKQIMFPQLQEMQSSFKKASKDLEGKSHVVLDITKWKIQGALGDLKKLFREMAKAQDSLLEGDLLHCLEKVGEGITTMITVYDRIDSYVEQSKLAALISAVATGSDDIKDPTLAKAAVTLDSVVRTNLVLERFESVMHALKQHKFPHARRYLEVFYKLPPGLQSNDTEEVIKGVMANIDFLKNQLIISKSTLEIPDINTFSDQYFGSIRPFYTWHHQDFDDEIQQLLNGRQITLKADISKGVNFTAVKFNEISINLKSANEMRQKELNAELEKFDIVMTMVGNNYYRCNNRIYYISMDKDVVLIFHMRNGTVRGKNDIYRKISESDYFLSPYTVWNIQLTSKTYVAPFLAHFKSSVKSSENEKIDLQLTGVGQIIKNKVKTELEVCNDDLDNYYTIDGIY